MSDNAGTPASPVILNQRVLPQRNTGGPERCRHKLSSGVRHDATIQQVPDLQCRSDGVYGYTMHKVQTFDRKAVFAISVLTMMAVTGAQAQDRVVSPESVGFSTVGLNEFQRTMRALVDEGSLAGITTLVARHGKVVLFDAYGVQSLASKKPVTKDTIFRIASMTKPIVGAAMMMLWEQGSGRWMIRWPNISRSLPI